MRVRTLNIIYSIVFITIAALLYWVSFGEEVIGRPISRDPVWYPRVLLLLSVGTGVILLIRGLLNGQKSQSLLFGGSFWLSPWQARVSTFFCFNALGSFQTRSC